MDWCGWRHSCIIGKGAPGCPRKDTDWPRRFDTTRATAERVNGRLKDDFGGRNVRVRSHDKVICLPDVRRPDARRRSVDTPAHVAFGPLSFGNAHAYLRRKRRRKDMPNIIPDAFSSQIRTAKSGKTTKRCQNKTHRVKTVSSQQEFCSWLLCSRISSDG